jgi:hypothetical protein
MMGVGANTTNCTPQQTHHIDQAIVSASMDIMGCSFGLCGTGIDNSLRLKKYWVHWLESAEYHCYGVGETVGDPFDTIVGHPIVGASNMFEDGTNPYSAYSERVLGVQLKTIHLAPAALFSRQSEFPATIDPVNIRCPKKTLAHEAMHIVLGSMSYSEYLSGKPFSLDPFLMGENPAFIQKYGYEEDAINKHVEECVSCSP